MFEDAKPLELIPIDENSYRIEDNGVRCFLFVGTEKALLIDTGFGNAGSLKALINTVTDKPVFLVNTHADIDHCGKNGEFELTHIHPSEMAHFYASKSGLSAAPLWEGDIIDIGGDCFETVLIPGHTPGSIALLNRNRRIIITGDTVSTAPVFMFSENRSLAAYRESLKKLIALSDSYDKIYPSHGDFDMPANQTEKLLFAAEKLAAGELEPIAPPFPMPAKLYTYEGASFFY